MSRCADHTRLLREDSQSLRWLLLNAAHALDDLDQRLQALESKAGSAPAADSDSAIAKLRAMCVARDESLFPPFILSGDYRVAYCTALSLVVDAIDKLLAEPPAEAKR